MLFDHYRFVLHILSTSIYAYRISTTSEFIHAGVLTFMCTHRTSNKTSEVWNVTIEFRGADGTGDHIVFDELDKGQLDLYAITGFKDQLGYATRDYMYYQRRKLDDTSTTSLHAIDVKPRAAGLLIGIDCSKVRDSAWMYLTSLVTTRKGIGLVAVQGNYPIVL